MRREPVPLPSADVERSKAFYVDQVGFNVDHDVEPGNGTHVVQLTPPGSACSIVIGVGISDPKAAPVLKLHLAVDGSARCLSLRGMDISHDVRAVHLRTASQVGAGKVSGHRHGQGAVADLDLRRWAL
jgi:hypothetical protein